jgi:DNA-binding transcriptional LysR family regulator
MNLAALDLNLLVALDALLREGSVSRAADRIGLSQPATSHALRRLREVFDDPLLVRAGARMDLTPRAEALREPLASALAQIRGLFAEEPFDPAESRRAFKAMIPDVCTSVLLPPLVRRLEAEAPHVSLTLAPFRTPGLMTPEVAGRLDFMVAYQAHDFAGFHRERIYTDSDALAVRSDRPDAERLSSLDAFLAAKHVAIVPRGESIDPIDAWLGELGHQRDVALTVPTYLQGLEAAALTDLVAFVPSRLIAARGPDLGLRRIEPPLDTGEDEQFLLHPTRVHADPASMWIRRLVLEIGRGLDRPDTLAQ